MIVFDLKCDGGHQFEAWFKSSGAYEDQLTAGQVICPFCESSAISKAPMAPNIAAKSNSRPDPLASKALSRQDAEPVELSGAGDEKLVALAREANKVFAKLKKHVESNCDYVGGNFAEEARKIHYGESEERGIYGESTREETVELLEEGIEVLPLPGTPVRGNDA